MKTILMFAFFAGFSLTAQAKDDGSTLATIADIIGSQKFIEVERIYQGEGKYEVLVNTSIPGKKSRDVGSLLVKDKKDGDYFTVVETLCNPTTVMPTTRESDRISFHCFTK